jgi:hypothetical protein
LLVIQEALHPTEYYCRVAATGRISFAVAEQRHHLFRELEAEQLVYGTIVVQRHAENRPPFTLRRERAADSGAAETDRLLGWSTRLAREPRLPGVLAWRPALSSHARLHVVHSVENGQWKVSTCRAIVDYPFLRTIDMSMNAGLLLSLFDGERSVAETLRHIKEAGAIPAELPPEAFAEFVQELVGEGVLRIDER